MSSGSAVVDSQTGNQPRRVSGLHLPKRMVFAVPGLLLFTAFVLIPLVLSLYYSLTNKSLIFPKTRFVGMGNYLRILTDAQFLATFRFTLVLTAVTLISVNVVGLGIALLLNKLGKIFFAMRMVFFIPVALSGVIIAFLWSTILTDDGLLNTMLRNLGLGNFAGHWLDTPTMAQGSVITVSSWSSLGLCIVIYLAGLQTVPADLLDAAKIDGCGAVNAFRHITWPLLASSLTINSTLLLINGFKSYDIPVVLTATGPGNATSTMATEVIRVGFSLNRVGLASAMAVLMVALVAVITITVTLILQKREVSS